MFLLSRRYRIASSNRNQALDILRGIAILLVLGYHYGYFYLWRQIGWAGVDLFFVLSGFLISGLLFNEYIKTGKIDVGRFLVRRGFKIYPAYYFLICLTAICLLMTKRPEARNLFGEFFFLQNYAPHIWAHTWSLAVEEHFYLMLPLLLVLLIRKRSLHAVPWIFAALAATCLSLRIIEANMGVSPLVLRLQTHLRIDALFCGVALCYWKTFHCKSFKRMARKPLWLGLLLLTPAFFVHSNGRFMNTFGLTLTYTSFGLLLIWAVEKGPSRSFLHKGIAWIGRYSYSIYLWHFPVLLILNRGQMSLRFFVEGLLISIAFGYAMALAIEAPSLALRAKLFPHATAKKLEVPLKATRPPVAYSAVGGNQSAA